MVFTIINTYEYPIVVASSSSNSLRNDYSYIVKVPPIWQRIFGEAPWVHDFFTVTMKWNIGLEHNEWINACITLQESERSISNYYQFFSLSRDKVPDGSGLRLRKWPRSGVSFKTRHSSSSDRVENVGCPPLESEISVQVDAPESRFRGQLWLTLYFTGELLPARVEQSTEPVIRWPIFSPHSVCAMRKDVSG